jgi:antitoxin (DNA-binding transcriptional repressor) of toxin-antitoxin stability system
VKTVTKRQLNQQTAAVLAAASAGEDVVVTERGVARWRIEAITENPDPIARLRAQGRIAPPKADPAPWPKLRGKRYTPGQVDALYEQMRSDR